jgi:O-antigen ligase
MASIFDAEQDPSGSREARKTLLKEGWRIFLANPLIGVGAGQFTNYNPDSRQEAWRQTHNAPLQVASELGLVGVVAFGFMIWTGFAAGFFAIRQARRAAGQRRARAPADRRAPRAPFRLTDAEWVELNGAMIVASMFGWFIAAQFASVAYYWTLYFVLGIAAGLREVAVHLHRPASEPRRSAGLRAA